MRIVYAILFFALFIGILTGANIYLIRRFNFFFSIEQTHWLMIIFPVLTLLMFFGVMPLSNATSMTANLVYRISAMIMGSLLFLLLSTLLVDLLRLFTSFQPRVYGIGALALTFVLVVFSTFNSFNIRIKNHQVPIAGLQNEIRAMHWSDVHLGHFRGKHFLQQIVDKTNEQNPEVVFLTGDLFDGRIRLNERDLQPLKELKAPLFFVEGNHDRYSGIEDAKSLLRKMGVQVLENQLTQWNGLQIIGLDHMLADSSSFKMHAAANGHTISSVLDSLQPDPTKPTILLHHSPDGVQYAGKHGIDLYLSGHTHAGQLWPIKHIAALMFRFNEGMHALGKTKLYVSHGTGTFGPPMRLGTQSEISLFNLVPQLN